MKFQLLELYFRSTSYSMYRSTLAEIILKRQGVCLQKCPFIDVSMSLSALVHLRRYAAILNTANKLTVV